VIDGLVPARNLLTAARLAFAVLVLIAAGPATGCIWVKTHAPVERGTRLAIVDAKTGEPVQDVDVFTYARVEGLGWNYWGFCENFWHKVFRRYEGRNGSPIVVPRRKYAVPHYNFLSDAKTASRCSAAVILYKRGYLTTAWIPPEDSPRGAGGRSPIEIKMTKLAGSLTAEYAIDALLVWLLSEYPVRSHSVASCQDGRHHEGRSARHLLQDAAPLRREISKRSAFKRVVRFAIGEYEALLADAAIDDATQARLREKIAGLSRMTE
jgi:hypothetical protein